MTLKELKNKIIEVLTNKNGTFFYVEFPKINKEALRQKIIAVLHNKHGGLDIPDDEIEAIADIILPGIIKFFSTEEGHAEFEAWKKERELLLVQKENENKVS